MRCSSPGGLLWAGLTRWGPESGWTPPVICLWVRRSRPGQLANRPSTRDRAHRAQAAGCKGWASIRPGRPRHAGSPRTQHLREITALLRGNSQSRQFHPFRMCNSVDAAYRHACSQPQNQEREERDASFPVRGFKGWAGVGAGTGTHQVSLEAALPVREGRNPADASSVAGLRGVLCLSWGLALGQPFCGLKAPGAHPARQPEVLFVYFFFLASAELSSFLLPYPNLCFFSGGSSCIEIESTRQPVLSLTAHDSKVLSEFRVLQPSPQSTLEHFHHSIKEPRPLSLRWPSGPGFSR